MTRINTNVPSLVAQNRLQASNSDLNSALTRLSTGLRINSGADDPAGLIASEALRSEITGLNKAVTNTRRAGQIITTADSAMGQINSLLNDARMMVVERGSGRIEHLHVRDLPDVLDPRDALVLNNSRVIPARLVGCRKETGGRWQGLFLRGDKDSGVWEILTKTRGKLKPVLATVELACVAAVSTTTSTVSEPLAPVCALWILESATDPTLPIVLV